MNNPLSLIGSISAPCGRCGEPGHWGTRHSVKATGSKALLRCLGCGSGYAISTDALPRGAPPELVIQAIINLIVNRQADILPPDPGPPDETAP